MLALFGQQFGPLLNSAVALDDTTGASAVKALARLPGCYFELQLVHWSVSAGVERVRSLSTNVVPR